MTDPSPPDSPQRQRILDSAVAILAESGQGGLTVRAVTAASGVSTSGIYTWFGGKDGLLDAIYTDGFARFREYIAFHDAEPDPRERLRLSGERYWEWALANPTHYILIFAGVPGQWRPSDDSANQALCAYDDLVARVAAWTQDDIAHHLWATLHGYAMLHLSAPTVEPDEAHARFVRGLDYLLG